MDQLNPKLFLETRLRSEVREKILRIVEEFLSTIDINHEIPVLDIILVGSNASYSYTDKSDLDIHLVVNFEDLCDKEDIVQELFNSERSLFNKNYDVKIKGIDVEMYVEDINTNTVSNGIYSVKDNEWIKYPDLIEDAEDVRGTVKFNNVLSVVTSAITSTELDEASGVLDQLYLMRKYSIGTSGERGFGNLVFKEIRNLGLLDALKDHILDLKSQDLSLENFTVKERYDS